MLSSRLLDTTDKCDIIQQSLKDNLYPYTISADGSTINYSNNTSQTINYNQLSAIGTLANGSYSDINDSSMTDCWLPVIVDNDTFVNNKMLSDDGSYANANPSLGSGRLGIENFLSFGPSFRNFSSPGQMSIDWLLNRHNIPYAIYYGIMCWVRRNGTSNVMTIGGSSAKLEVFPKGTRLKHSSRPNDILIKIDNNTLYIVNSQRYTVGTSITHNDENTFILQAGTISPDSYSLADTTTKETWTASSTTASTENVDGFSIPGLTDNVRLWIPDGDCIFYYESESEKILAEVAGVPTNGFISPCLTRYYTNIYRILTLDQSRSFAKKNLKISRSYRKLAHALSTSPFIGEFAIRALDCRDIKTIVNTYITDSASSNNIDREKLLLKTALKDISLYLQKTITTGGGTSNTGVYVDTKPSPYSLNNNLISNKNQLFNKLITKYGANLLISGSTTITVDYTLFKDNSGVVITQGMDYYCPKNTANTIISNNQTITYDGTKIQTVMSNTESRISIQSASTNKELESIPLYDIAKPDINGNNTRFRPKLMTLGYINREYMSNGELYNPANNSDTASLVYKYAMKTESCYEISSSTTRELTLNPAVIGGKDNGPELDAMDLVLNVRDSDSLLVHETYVENQMAYYWEKLSGPNDCEFIELNGGFSNTTRPSNTTANSRYIRLRIKNVGKYVVQCTVNSPYGTFKKQKTIYIYDGADLVLKKGIPNFTLDEYVTNPLINQYYDENTETWNPVPTIPANDPEFQPIYLNRDNLRVRCSKFNRVAISQIGGVFVPINTGFTVREIIGMTGPVPATEVVKLDELYKFSTKRPFVQTNSATLTIKYGLESNTLAKISSIYIEKVRSNISGCEQCYSLYEPKLRATKTTVFTGSSRVNTVRYNRINKAPEGFSFYKYESNEGGIAANPTETVPFGYPIITTDKSPPVKTYGGYNNSIINSFNIQNNINNTVYKSTIPGLSRPTDHRGDANSLAAGQPSILPPVSGFPLDVVNDQNPAKHKLCYQRQLPYVGGGPITFTKGVLHPNSGWIPHTSNDYAIHANRSSVLKFNPGARSTFSFIGPKLSNISSISANIPSNTIEPNILSSSVELKIAPGVQWDPECTCSPSAAISLQTYNDNQKHKEYIDTTTNRSSHGYRYLAGGQPKPLERTALTNVATYNDEFETDQDGDTFSYSFAVTGPASLPSEINGSDGKKHLRIPTVQNFGIKDIEVKLNFLNYINTKNLVIWLEVQPDAKETQSRLATGDPARYPSPITAPQKFVDQTIPAVIVSGTPLSYKASVDSSLLYNNIPNPKIANYLDCLLNAEKDTPGGPLSLLLLNQEHIENNGYNFSVKFSDNASKYNVLYDQNIINGTPVTIGTFYPSSQLANIDKQQNIIRNNGIVKPSLAANLYTDRQACEFSKVLRNNRLNITAASFSKFNTNTLFRNKQPEFGPCPPEKAPEQQAGDLNSSTKFTLKIMVLDETDDMSPNDTLISNQYLTGLSSSDKTQTSTDIFNSLCNWELILHVGEVPKFVPHTNPNLASYGNCDALSLLDYTKNLKYPGYSFIADLTNYQHLLPLANIDAPNTAIADTSLCLTDKNDPIGTGFVVKPVKFPDYAIVQILASLISPTTGTLIGTTWAAGAGYALGFSAIISWFGETRFLSNLEDSGRQIFTQSYTKYPFGSPEKILLNVKKPNSLWYSLEATIMKYHNTPILQLKKHNYVKVQRGVSKYATEFGFNTISDYQELLDLKNIPEISLSCNGALPFPAASITYPTTDYGNRIINYGDLVNVTVTDCSNTNNNGLYVTLDTGWSKITNQSIGNLTKSISFLKYNSVLSYRNSLFYDGLKDDIAASKVIICPTRIPYDIFFVGDTVECYSKGDRLLSSGGSIISVNIVKKGLINKNNKLYSVFVLDTAITSQDTISPTPATNTVLVYSNNTTRENGINKDYNAWGLDSNGYVKETPPYAGFSAHSVGSYGNVSPFVNKNLLDKNFRYNSLQPAHKILNNHENDKIQKNKLTIYNYSNDSLSEISAFSNDMACGFSYNENDLYDTSVVQTKTSNVVVTPENTRQVNGDFGNLSDGLFDQIKNTTGHNETNYSFMYIRTSSSSSSTTTATIPLSGYITIENNYEEYIPIKFIDLDNIISRLNTIDTLKIQPSLENVVGDSSQTATVLASSNINYIQKHLKKLVKEDPSSCHRPGAVINDCPKLITQTKLNKLYSERTDLIKLLEQQAVQSASVSYKDNTGNTQTITGTIVAENSTSISLNNFFSLTGTVVKISKSDIINTDTDYGLIRTFTRKDQLPANHIHKLSPDILPKIEPVITTNTDNSINIQYSGININHYWINIDPKQSCVLDFTSNPKVLSSTEYFCIRANESSLNYTGTSVIADNNVCPDFVNKEKVPQFPVDAIGDEGFTVSNREYKYIIPYDIVERNKAIFVGQYPAITGWTQHTKERFFNINADASLGVEGEGSETTVRSKETYWIPLIDNTPTYIDGSADTQTVPGVKQCQTNFGSPGGSGLLASEYTGQGRVGASTRVQSILNLDDVNSIEVQIKRIPRMLRGCDILGTVYRYGNRALFRQQSSSNPRVPFEVDGIGINGPLNNGLYCWICLQQRSTDNSLRYASIPPFLQHQNEMIFRSFFGSVDRIENRTDLMVSYYPWELIPYEYAADS
jgi:hypothetical protein